LNSCFQNESQHYWFLANSCQRTDHVTANLQIPYLLSLAGIVADYLPAFPFVERPTLRLVDKLDQAFASLLSQGRHSASPIADGAIDYLVSVTDRVRIRSVIECTRIIAVETTAKSGASADLPDVSESFTDSEYEDHAAADGNRQERDSLDMGISKMYERSLNILGDSLG
jgi:Subunit 11 of the general transcription factor TFIIH